MSNNPYVNINRVIDTVEGRRKVVDFLHMKEISNTEITFLSASWVATPGGVDGEYYQDFTITGLTNKHVPLVILDTNALDYLDKGNFTTCYVLADGKLRLFWTAPIVNSSSITIPTIITFETTSTAPKRGILNSGAGGSGSGEWTYDPADMNVFISYLDALGDLSAYYVELQNVIDGFATYISTGTIDADAIMANSIDTRHLVVHSPNLINDFDSFEQFKNQDLAGEAGEPLVPVNYSGTVTADVVNTTAFHGSYSLQLTNTTINDYIYLNPTTFNVVNWLKLESAGIYGLSLYAKVNDAVLTEEYGTLSLYDVSGTPTLVGSSVPILGTNNTWKRFSTKFIIGGTSISNIVVSGTTATVNISSYSFSNGNQINIKNMFNSSLNGLFTISNVINMLSFTIDITGLGLADGTYSGNNPTAILTTLSSTINATLRIDFSKATSNFYIDAIQLERLESINDDISEFSSGGVSTISGDNITTGTIDASVANITNINADNINTGALNADLITTGTLDASIINVENLDANKITTGFLDALRIATGSLDADRITSKTIEAEQIKSFSITATEISSNAITTEKLFAESVTAAKIAAESIDSTKLNAVFGNFTGTLKVGPVGNDITLSGIEGAAKIYTGLGNHGGTTTGFYLDDTGKFSLTNQLIFTPGLENTLSELEITGKIRGIIESVEPIPSVKLSSTITQIVVNGDGTIGTITTTGHSFMVGERILISGMTETLFNRAYTISSIIDSTIFTIEIIDFIITAGTYTGTDPVAELQELTMGLHLSEHFGTSYYHNAGSGIRLDKYNWWLTNNQFRVGTASTYFKWNGDTFNITGSGNKSLVFNVGSSDANNIISIVDSNETPTYKRNTTPFYVDGSGQFSLGDQLYWDGSILTIAADVIIQPIASLEQTVSTMTSTITNVNNTFSFLPTGLEIRNESTSTNYIKIDNDSIDFMTENGIVATMASVDDDTYMEIKDARISNSIELGVHRIRRYDTGGNSYTIFEWKGV